MTYGKITKSQFSLRLKTQPRIALLTVGAALTIILLFPLPAVAAVVITEYPVPTSSSYPLAITAGPTKPSAPR
jgi:hypothetical protein